MILVLATSRGVVSAAEMPPATAPHTDDSLDETLTNQNQVFSVIDQSESSNYSTVIDQRESSIILD